MKPRQLRIHGVSGTPADEMLATDPIDVESRLNGKVSILEPVPVDPDVRAYRWSSLTSGTPTSALWVGLLPFLIANLAGWALPLLPRRLERVAAGLVRLAGLTLTTIIALVTAHGFMDIGGFQYLHLETGVLSLGGAIALGGTVSGFVITALWGLLSSTAESAEAEGDPIDRCCIGSDRLWRTHAVESRLRLVHLSVAFLAIVWMATEMMNSAGIRPNPSRFLVTLAGIPFLVVGASIGLAFGLRIGKLAEACVVTSALSLVWTTVEYASIPPSRSGTVEFLTASSHPISIAVLLFTSLTVAVLMVGYGSRQKRNLATAPALLAISGIGGAGVGAALLSAGSRALGSRPPEWVGRASEAFLTGLTLLTFLVGLILLTARINRTGSRFVLLMRSFRQLRDSAPILLWTVVIGSLGIVMGMVGDRLRWWEFRIPATFPFILGLSGLLLVAVWLLSLRFVGLGLAVSFSLLVVWVWMVRGENLWNVDYSRIATIVTILIPASLVLGRVIGAFRNNERRRELAAIWDLGSFLPRWYHPFAPPPYGPRAVPDLAEYISTQDGPLVVAGHSQGSVLALAAFADQATPLKNVALLTFGSPLGPFYARFFPNVFSDIEHLTATLEGRWLNLEREDDPVAGPVGFGVDIPALDDPNGRGHADYWLEPEFDRAVQLLGDQISRNEGNKLRGFVVDGSVNHIHQKLKDPNTLIAVIGATDKPRKYGGIIYRDLRDRGHRVVAVNPSVTEVSGDPCYPCLSDLPELPEIVNVVIPAARALNTVAEAAKLKNKPAIWLQPGVDGPPVADAVVEAGLDLVDGDCIMVVSRLINAPV